MRHLHFDCFSGIAGDMTLAALLDLGASEAALRDGLAALSLSQAFELKIWRESRHNIFGNRLSVLVGGREADELANQGPGAHVHEHTHQHSHEHAHDGHTHEHPHTHHHAHPHQHDGHGAEHHHAEAGHPHEHGANQHGPHEHAGHTHPHPHHHDHNPAHEHGHGHVAHAAHAHEHHGHGHDHGHPHPHAHPHPHSHAHPHSHEDGHEHRPFREIRALIEGSRLVAPVKSLALRIFQRLAEAEAKIHDQTVDAVEFHEVGALDAIVDIVGSAILLHDLAPERISASPLPMGHGFIRCRHGRMPVPAPATLEVLRGVPLYDAKVRAELVTPTGAAIIAATATQFGRFVDMVPRRVGYGLGKMKLEDRPNLLRVVLGDS